MNQRLIDQLIQATKKEQKISERNQPVQKSIDVRLYPCLSEFPVHTHKYIEIMYLCRGTVTHIVEGKELTMLPGDFLFINQHVHHCAQKAEETDIGINFSALPHFFDIPLSMLQKDNMLADFLIGIFQRDVVNACHLHLSTGGDQAIENLMENMVDAILNGGGRYEHINQLTMGVVLQHLLYYVSTLRETSPQNYVDSLVKSILQYINENYQTASLTEFANAANQSRIYLSKLIKKQTGNTFKEHLQRKRYQKAVEVLVDTNLSVSNIMASVGYENSTYFYQKFNEKYNMSPKEYRRDHKNDTSIRV